jgi:regulator of sigma E protease
MRLAVLVAGPAANYLTAVVLAIGLFIGYGKPTPTQTVDEVSAGWPAQAAGLKKGDVLLSGNGKTVSKDYGISKVIEEGQGKPVEVKLRRGQEVLTFNITPRKDPKDGAYRIGIPARAAHPARPPLTAIKDAAVLPFTQSVMFLDGIWKMITGAEKANLSGPVGITRELAKRADQGMLSFLNLVIALSIYLGLFNLLPLPALDGGRVLFLGVNALRRRTSTRRRRPPSTWWASCCCWACSWWSPSRTSRTSSSSS